MFETHDVEVRFERSGWIQRTVELGVLASDEYAIETAREEIEAERDDLGAFRSGRFVA